MEVICKKTGEPKEYKQIVNERYQSGGCFYEILEHFSSPLRKTKKVVKVLQTPDRLTRKQTAAIRHFVENSPICDGPSLEASRYGENHSKPQSIVSSSIEEASLSFSTAEYTARFASRLLKDTMMAPALEYHISGDRPEEVHDYTILIYEVQDGWGKERILAAWLYQGMALDSVYPGDTDVHFRFVGKAPKTDSSVEALAREDRKKTLVEEARRVISDLADEATISWKAYSRLSHLISAVDADKSPEEVQTVAEADIEVCEGDAEPCPPEGFDGDGPVDGPAPEPALEDYVTTIGGVKYRLTPVEKTLAEKLNASSTGARTEFKFQLDADDPNPSATIETVLQQIREAYERGDIDEVSIKGLQALKTGAVPSQEC